MVVALAWATFACATTGGMQYPRPMGEERIDHGDTCLDIQDCYAFRHYYHVGTDPGVGTVKWLISDQRHACVVTDAELVLAVPGALWPCASGWRFYRP
jgi:hypothetical protein